MTFNDEDPNCSQPQPQEAVDTDSNLENNKLSISRRKSRVLPTKELQETIGTLFYLLQGGQQPGKPEKVRELKPTWKTWKSQGISLLVTEKE